MDLTQKIILYFFILPLISFLIIAVIESVRENKKALISKNRKLRKTIEDRENFIGTLRAELGDRNAEIQELKLKLKNKDECIKKLEVSSKHDNTSK